MDYSKRLEESVGKFERETGKLLKINKLIQDTAELNEAITKQTEFFQKVAKQLEITQAQITKDTAALEKYTANEETARQKLLDEIHQNVIADSKIIISKLAAPLMDAQNQLAENNVKLNQLIETHQKSQEIFLANLETLLIKYNTKNLELYNNIIDTLSHKIEIAKDNTEANLNRQLNICIQDISNLGNNLAQDTKKLRDGINNVSEEVQALQKISPIIQQIKWAIYAAIGTGLLSCAANFF